MNRILLLTASLIPFSTVANDTLVDSIERFTDIFAVSFSQQKGTTVTTLDANYLITDNLRVFGDVDTELNWEVGAGYSFWQGPTYYTENNIKVSEHKLTSGIFVAKLIHDDWTLLGDLNYNHYYGNDGCFTNSCWEYRKSNSFDYSAGVIWSPIQRADFLFKYNHEVGIKEDKWYWQDNNLNAFNSRTNKHYYEVATFIDMKYLKPSITYTIRPDNDNYVEFGLAFEF